MIVLFTDFGIRDPYVGQLHAAVHERTGVPVIDLLHHVPDYDMRAGAYLLDALQRRFPAATIFVGVVDPGVGGDRTPVMVKADDKWYVGPDNGLFNIVCRRAGSVETCRIDWRPPSLSASFHGRDLFAPVAAQLAEGNVPDSSAWTLLETPAWPEELAEVIYIDHYGNAMTGIRADSVTESALVEAKGRRLAHARTFSSAPPGAPFWYRNSIDLVELAVGQDSAALHLDLHPGESIRVIDYEALMNP